MDEETKAYLELFAKHLEKCGANYDAGGVRDFSRNCETVIAFMKNNPPPTPMDPWQATAFVTAAGAFLTLYKK